jgi:hypothetical protein
LPRVEEAARHGGFRNYAVEWTLSGNAVVLTLWGERGTYAAIGRGRRRSQAVLAALAVILANIPPEPAFHAAPEADRGSGAWHDAGERAEDHVPPQSPDWWREALGLGPDATRAQADSAWRTLARKAHPDLGGSTERMARLNAARDEARRVLGRGGLATGSV